MVRNVGTEEKGWSRGPWQCREMGALSRGPRDPVTWPCPVPPGCQKVGGSGGTCPQRIWPPGGAAGHQGYCWAAGLHWGAHWLPRSGSRHHCLAVRRAAGVGNRLVRGAAYDQGPAPCKILISRLSGEGLGEPGHLSIFPLGKLERYTTCWWPWVLSH